MSVSVAQHYKQNSLCYYSNHGIYEVIEHPNVRLDNWLLMKKGERFLTKERNNLKSNFLGG